MCFQVNKPVSPLVEEQLHHRPTCRADLSATRESFSSARWKIAKITLKMFYTTRRFVSKYLSLCTTYKLTELNLGNNALKEVPAVLGHLESLRNLYLFSNQITVVPHEVMGRFLAAPHDLHLGRFVKKAKINFLIVVLYRFAKS